MNNQVSVAAPTLEVVDGKVMTTSLMVAEFFGKRHDTVLRAIRNLDCSDDFCARNFVGTKYEIKKGEPRNMFNMTKNGFVFLVMGFTGKLAASFKEAYIKEFDRMQEQIQGGTALDPVVGDLLMKVASHYQNNDMMVLPRAKYNAMKEAFDNLAEIVSDVQTERLEVQLQAFDSITSNIDAECSELPTKLKLIK